MSSAFIKYSDYYLPEQTLTNHDLTEIFPEWSAEKIANKVGVKTRHICGETETAVDLAQKAAELLFERNGIDRNSVDFLLLCTQSPDYFLPTSACVLQHRLGLPKECGALDFNLGCSGYIYGLSIAKGLILGGVANNILLLTSETYTKHIHPEDKGNRTIFGDAATATLISTGGFAEIGNFSLGTDGAGAENLIVKTGAMRFRNALNDAKVDKNGVFCSSDYLHMNGGEIFNFSSDVVPALIEKVLKKNNLSETQIDLYIFHQANKYMINYLRKLLNIDEEHFYVFLESVGNTVSSTIPIALTEAKKANRLKGQVILAGFGVGYSWGGVSIKIKK